jgi:tRNA (guanine37-N1)-methyltransferase
MRDKTLPNSYKDITKIPKKLKDKLPTSFDIIGNIILIKLENNMLEYKIEIANALLQTQKNIKTVCLIHPVSGELRTRQIEILSGENNTETIHKEYGVVFYLDVSKVYFSSRLSSERKRIADLVKKNEIIVDMFAGVAPFSIMIAKYAYPKIIYAIDKNKDAIEYAKINITKNRALDKIDAIHDDARIFLKKLYKKNVRADRIIMNLPFSAFEFFEDALNVINKNAIIHYYDIIIEDDIQRRIDKLKKLGKENNIHISNFNVRRIKSYSPREFYIGIDITAKKR